MEFKHTKGPWEAISFEGQDSFIHVSTPNGFLVASEIDGDDLTEREANTKLIASAPELLEALIRCVEDLENQTTQVEKERTILIAKQAINKATS